MSRSYINADLWRLVADRADYLCEYCLIAEAERSSAYQVDRIISVRHGGLMTEDNLAFEFNPAPRVA